jgi:Na+/H+ antiporter NhaD/arsenite permease-like protein
VGISSVRWVTSIIFAITYAGLAVGKVPRLRLDRAGIAFVGAALMLCTGMLTLAQATAPDCIDYETLFLLFGMMVVVGFLRISGLLSLLAHLALDHIHSPRRLLAVVIALSGLLSAFLVNDVVCLALTPLVLHLARRRRFDPVPHLIALATAANIGSAATITGNPQNMIIGMQSRIPYLHFALNLMPVALLGLAVDFLVIALVYRGALVRRAPDPDVSDARRLLPRRPVHVWLQWKSAVVAAVTVALFFTGLPIALVATGAAALLMIGRVKPSRIYREIDWSLLLMFVGLFIVVHAFQLHVVSSWGIDGWHPLLTHPVDLLSVTSAALSNLVSNVPAVLLFEPLLHAMHPAIQPTAWLALAMSSTFAGNLTILGSVANLIVVESARREGVRISFWEYSKAGIPITIITLALGILWLTYFHVS